eukprot:scaffold236672_cov17-Tisochrysis_lutea.AAC.1
MTPFVLLPFAWESPGKSHCPQRLQLPFCLTCALWNLGIELLLYVRQRSLFHTLIARLVLVAFPDAVPQEPRNMKAMPPAGVPSHYKHKGAG